MVKSTAVISDKYLELVDHQVAFLPNALGDEVIQYPFSPSDKVR